VFLFFPTRVIRRTQLVSNNAADNCALLINVHGHSKGRKASACPYGSNR
jgi:hypothetical protein